jgi:hypothetical protein
MRYEDWISREAEVWLAEHAELRTALGLQSVPDYTTLYRFLRRLSEAVLEWSQTRGPLGSPDRPRRPGADGP